MRILLAFLAFVVISCLANCVRANPAETADPSQPADKRLAKLRYDEGVTAFKTGDFAQAERLFEEANSLDPNAVLLYNLARTREELGKYADAIRLFEAYIARAEPTTAERGEAAERITSLRVKLAEQGQKTPAPTAKPPPRIAEKQPDPAPTAKQPAVAIDETKLVPPTPFYRRLPPWYSWIAFGSGVAATGGAIFLGVEASDRADTADSPRTTQIDARRARDEADQFATGSYVLWGTAGVAVAAGVVLWVLDVQDPPTIAPSQNGAALGFSF